MCVCNWYSLSVLRTAATTVRFETLCLVSHGLLRLLQELLGTVAKLRKNRSVRMAVPTNLENATQYEHSENKGGKLLLLIAGTAKERKLSSAA